MAARDKYFMRLEDYMSSVGRLISADRPDRAVDALFMICVGHSKSEYGQFVSTAGRISSEHRQV
jgi:hypothetical protein